MFIVENLPQVFLLNLVRHLNTFEMINFLISVERKYKPNELTQTDLYKIIFDQK